MENLNHPLPADLSSVTIETRWEYDYSNRIKRRIRLNDGRVIETQRLTNAEVERYLAENPAIALPIRAIRGKQIDPMFSRRDSFEPLPPIKAEPEPAPEPIIKDAKAAAVEMPESLQGREFGNLTVTLDTGKATVAVQCKCGKVIEKFNRKFLIVSGQKSCSRACPFSVWSKKKPFTVPITPSMISEEAPDIAPEPVNVTAPPSKTLTRENKSEQILAVIEAARKINIDDVHSLLAALETIEIKIPSGLLPFLGNPYLGLRKAKANLRALGYFITSIAGTKE